MKLASCLFAVGVLSLSLFAVPAGAEDGKIEPPVASLSEAARAQQALDEFIQAYQSGNIGLLRSHLDPAMIGYQRFVDGMIQDASRLKQVRLHLLDTQAVVGPDVAMIQTSWEKRFLSTTDLRPGIYTGRSQFLMHKGKDGWRVAAIGGDNPFSSQSGVLGRLALTRFGSAAPAVTVEVVDPDIAGVGSINVTVFSGTSEVPVPLSETTPGRFVSLSPTAVFAGLVTLRYMDANPGGGRPPSLLTRSIMVSP